MESGKGLTDGHHNPGIGSWVTPLWSGCRQSRQPRPIIYYEAQTWHEALQFQVGRQVILKGKLAAPSQRQDKLFAVF